MNERLSELVREFKAVPVAQRHPLYIVDIEYNVNDGEYVVKDVIEFDSDEELEDYLEIAKLVGTFKCVSDSSLGPEFSEFFHCHDSGNCFPVHVEQIHYYPEGGEHLVAYAKF